MRIPYLVGQESLYADVRQNDLPRFLSQSVRSGKRKMRGCKAMTIYVAKNPRTAIAEIHALSARGEYRGNVPWARASGARPGSFSRQELEKLSGLYQRFTRGWGRRAVVPIGAEGKAVLEQLAMLHDDELGLIEHLGQL